MTNNNFCQRNVDRKGVYRSVDIFGHAFGKKEACDGSKSKDNQ